MRKNHCLIVLLSLTLLCYIVPARVLGEDEKDEGKEQKIKFSEVPAAAQKTITDEAKGAVIETVDKEDHDGKVIYEADAKINDKNYEIKVAEDGTLISKKLDNEEGEKGEKKGEKHEEK